MEHKREFLVTSALLAMETFGALLAAITAVHAIFVWGETDLSHYDSTQIWMINHAVYLLSGVILVYGIVLRPIRRRAVQKFSQIIHFSNKLIYWEIIFAIAVLIVGSLQISWLYLSILGIYSAWKIFEYSADYWIYIKKGGLDI